MVFGYSKDLRFLEDLGVERAEEAALSEVQIVVVKGVGKEGQIRGFR